MDRIFGVDCFRNEVIWYYYNKMHDRRKRLLPRAHDTILVYGRTPEPKFNQVEIPLDEPVKRLARKKVGGKAVNARDEKGNIVYITKEVRALDDIWRIPMLQPADRTYRIGYPTEKPPRLLEFAVRVSTDEGDTVADLFCGGGVTPFVAQLLGRRWIACDQSRVAVAITADRLTRQVEGQLPGTHTVPDFTIEHWGVYEARRLSDAPSNQFRGFVLKCFGGIEEGAEPGIHGYKGAIPLWIGEPDPKKAVTAADVQAFANAVRKTLRYKQDNLRDAMMLAWAFRPDAMEAAERLRRLEQADINFIRLDTIRIDSPMFREHVAALSTEKADYENFLTFVQPPHVEVGYKRLSTRTYRFDVSETVVMNSGAKIINVQWDFSYKDRFSSTPGFSFVRGKNKEPSLQADYEFPKAGKVRVACKVQDDMGGEGLWTDDLDVS